MIFTEKQTDQILDRLKECYPDAGCALVHKNRYELLIDVVLSAQTTDKSVNKISPKLFEKYPSAKELAEAEQDDVIDIIKTIGMYKTKSRNIISLAKVLCDKYGGEVPGTYDELIELPGVGRKTANVVLSVGFGQQRIAVDTHVFRVTNRIGWYRRKMFWKTELALMKCFLRTGGAEAHHSLYFTAGTAAVRKPKCSECVIADL